MSVLKTFILLEAFFLISGHVSAALKKKCCEVPKECFEFEWQFPPLPLPACPEVALEPHYEIYTRKNSETPEVASLGNMTENSFTTKKYYLVVHGYTVNAKNPKSIVMKNEFLKKDAATVILMDWNGLGSQEYSQSASNTRTAGAHLAKVIEKIRELVGSPYVWCLGHSLGAHVCGQAGRKSQIDRITGLDPAGPLMVKKGLKKDSAPFVDIIHTNEMFGTYSRMGHADFYVNEGIKQPACGESDQLCHHSIVMDYFAESINSPCFLAKKCPDVHSLPLSCTPCTSCFPMGYDADPCNTGIFYLETNAESPYCKK